MPRQRTTVDHSQLWDNPKKATYTFAYASFCGLADFVRQKRDFPENGENFSDVEREILRVAALEIAQRVYSEFRYLDRPLLI